MMFCHLWGGGKQFHIAPLMGKGGILHWASDSIAKTMHGKVLYPKLLCDRMLMCGNKGLYDMHCGRRMSRA